MEDASYWIGELGLEQHPEGGYYRETYRSTEEIPRSGLPERYAGPRNFGTSIYHLSTTEEPSRFHLLQSDEIFYFHYGAPMTVHVIDPSGNYQTTILGSTEKEVPKAFQTVIPRGSWFGASVEEPDSFSIIGCAVSPGFSFDDFQIADREELIALFPQHTDVITKLT